MPKPRNPRPASVRIASAPFSVMITGSDEVTLDSMWRNRIRVVLAPVTRAASTNGSTLTASVALRTTRKYCGTNTAMIATDADRMPASVITGHQAEYDTEQQRDDQRQHDHHQRGAGAVDHPRVHVLAPH